LSSIWFLVSISRQKSGPFDISEVQLLYRRFHSLARDEEWRNEKRGKSRDNATNPFFPRFEKIRGLRIGFGFTIRAKETSSRRAMHENVLRAYVVTPACNPALSPDDCPPILDNYAISDITFATPTRNITPRNFREVISARIDLTYTTRLFCWAAKLPPKN